MSDVKMVLSLPNNMPLSVALGLSLADHISAGRVSCALEAFEHVDLVPVAEPARPRLIEAHKGHENEPRGFEVSYIARSPSNGSLAMHLPADALNYMRGEAGRLGVTMAQFAREQVLAWLRSAPVADAVKSGKRLETLSLFEENGALFGVVVNATLRAALHEARHALAVDRAGVKHPDALRFRAALLAALSERATSREAA